MALIGQRESQRRADLLAERQRITSNLKLDRECDQSIERKLDILIAQIKATDFAGLKERSV
jgi:hypothetical protein